MIPTFSAGASSDWDLALYVHLTKNLNCRASNGPGNNSVHRRALTPINGTAAVAQRFAIDWTNRGADSNTYTGDPNANRSYHACGAEVLSVADAVVVARQGAIPENMPGASRGVPITPETIGDNYIILDLGLRSEGLPYLIDSYGVQNPARNWESRTGVVSSPSSCFALDI